MDNVGHVRITHIHMLSRGEIQKYNTGIYTHTQTYTYIYLFVFGLFLHTYTYTLNQEWICQLGFMCNSFTHIESCLFSATIAAPHRLGVKPSALIFHPSGHCPPSFPSQPPAIMATANNSPPELGKYGVGTRVPPIG